MEYEADYSKEREYSDQEIKSITENNKKDINQGGNAQLMTEWDEYMHDFIPEDISTVVINPRAKHVYNFSI